MNALRRYLVAIVAIAVAFAAGIALGGGPLQGDTDQRAQELTARNADLRDQLAGARVSGQVETSFVETSTGALVQGRLAQTTVAVVAMPGVTDADVETTRGALVDAGAQVTTTARLTDRLLDPTRKSYVESVVRNALSRSSGSSSTGVQPGPDPYESIGRLAAVAYAGSSGEGAGVDDTARTQIDDQLTGAELIALDAPAQAPASLLVVLDDGSGGSGAAAQARLAIASHVLDGWIAGTDGAVLVGPTPSSAPDGLFAALGATTAQRSSTINAAASPLAPVLTVLTLVEVRSGTTGRAYGVVDGRPVLPSGLGG